MPALFPKSGLELYLADAVRNVLLFAPLGAGLAWWGVRAIPALLLGAALSIGVELGQTLIPSRNYALIDVAFNTAGTFTGFVLARLLPFLVNPPPARERRLVLGAAVAIASGFAATAILFQPALQSERLVLHLTPKFSFRLQYPGEVVAAFLDGAPIPLRPRQDVSALEDRFERDFRLDLDVAMAPSPGRQAPLLLVSQEGSLHILELSVEGEDLVFQYRTRGKLIGLEPARVQWSGVLAGIPPGERVAVGVERRGRDLCLRVDAEDRCRLALSLGDGWQLFGLPFSFLAPLRPLTGPAWVALLCLPLGCWARPKAETAVALGLVGSALVLVPLPSALLLTPPSQLAGGALGVTAGILARRFVGARVAGPPPS